MYLKTKTIKQLHLNLQEKTTLCAVIINQRMNLNWGYQVLFDVSFSIKSEAAHVHFFVWIHSIDSYFYFIHQCFAHCKKKWIDINKCFE